ncbi:hypothetical protein NMG60_11031205 [Bertholletia excelsa]
MTFRARINSSYEVRCKCIHYPSCRHRKPAKAVDALLIQRENFSVDRSVMKRSIDAADDQATGADKKMKQTEPEEEVPAPDRSAFVLTDDNLLYEVLKHADARTLATAARVSRQWRKTAEDERLWEQICTRLWAANYGGAEPLRHVVLALGGFRRLYANFILPLSKPSSSSISAPVWPCSPSSSRPLAKPSATAGSGKARWGKDAVHVSLSLLSIRYYEKMNFNNRGK